MNATAENETQVFEAMLDIELDIKRSRAAEGFGTTPDIRFRAVQDTKRYKAELYKQLDALTPEQMERYYSFVLASRRTAD